MSYSKMATLVKKLADSTEQHNLTWQPTVDSSEYITALSTYTVGITFRPSNNEPNAADYYVRIYNENGDLLDESSDLALIQFMDNSYSVMRGLYEEARRQALGIDDALNIILKELNDRDLPF